MEDLDAVLGEVGMRGRGTEHVDEVSLGVLVLGEDEETSGIPGGVIVFGLLARRMDAGTHVLANPVDEITDAGIWQAAGLFRDGFHLVEQDLLGLEVCLG